MTTGTTIAWAILFNLYVLVIGASDFRYLDVLQSVKKERQHDHTIIHDSHSNDNNKNVEELYLGQRLDHFDHTNMVTFNQRYFLTKQYVVEDSSMEVTFLCVGGEGPEFDSSVLVDSVHCTGDMLELAQLLSQNHHVSVHVYALEHRYYGKSYPSFPNGKSPVTIQNLKYLSSRQALEDLAHFVRYINTREGRDTRWVTFGGSYPGFLAAHARLKYPHMIFAGVSSSAPMKIVVDFPGYYHVVKKDLKYSKVGGSASCYDIVKKGHEQAAQMADHQELASIFNVCDGDKLEERRNQEMLLGDGLIFVPSQSNDPSCTYELCNIQRLCEFIDDIHAANFTTTELEILALVASKQRKSDECVEVDWNKTLAELSRPIVTDNGWRSWLWQTCTEFGFYQTCEDEDCPFASSYHTVDIDLEICKVAFGVTDVYENIEASINYYGGLDVNGGSRVLFVNGDVDPWSALGLLNSTDAKFPAAVVPGASHHAWTHSKKASDSDEINTVRELIYSTVISWLHDESAATERARRGGIGSSLVKPAVSSI